MLIKGLSVSSSKAFSQGLCCSGDLCLTCKFFHLNQGVFCGCSLQELLCKPATTSLQKPGDVERRSRVMQLARCKNPVRNLMSWCQTKHPSTNHFVLPSSTSLGFPQCGTISPSYNPCHAKIPAFCNFFVQHAYPPSKSHASVAILPVASFQGSLMSQSGTRATGLSQNPMGACPTLLMPAQGHSQVNQHGLPHVNSRCNTLAVGASFIPFLHTAKPFHLHNHGFY